MDQLVVIADPYMHEVDTLPWLEGDFTIGEVNSFEVKVPGNLGIKQDWFLMVDGTEYGGVVDGIDTDSLQDYITVSGRTWHGILEDTPIKPPSGQTHTIVSGDVNVIMGNLINQARLNDRLMASREPSGYTVTNYKMLSKTGERYFDLYTGFRRMLNEVGCKLRIIYDSKERKAVVSAVPRDSYVEDGLDGEIVPIEIKITRPYNHLICLGAGEGLQRLVCDVYADVRGNVSTTQTITGIGYRGTLYENVNCDNMTDLRDYGIDNLTDMQSDLESCSLSGETAEFYDIDDIVGAKSVDQGLEIVTSIAEKIATFTDNRTIEYETKTELEVNS